MAKTDHHAEKLQARAHLQLADVVNGLQQERCLVQLVAVGNELPQLVEPKQKAATYEPCSSGLRLAAK